MVAAMPTIRFPVLHQLHMYITFRKLSHSCFPREKFPESEVAGVAGVADRFIYFINGNGVNKHELNKAD